MAEEKNKEITKNNVWRRLSQARMAFLQKGAKKSGVNRHMEFDYFELADIVPYAVPIFDEHGLLHIFNLTKDEATLTLTNCDNPEETIVFSVPMVEIKALTSNTGKVITTEIQSLGALITYLRRYLYMIALDIVENDIIDRGVDNPTSVKGTEAKKESRTTTAIKKPNIVTKAERKEIKKQNVDADGQADELQIKALKEALKTLREVDNTQEEFIKAIALKTEGFTKITKRAAEKLITSISDMIEELRDN